MSGVRYTQLGGRPTVVRMQLNSASATSLHFAGSAERTSPVAAQQPSMATNSALHGEGRRTEKRSPGAVMGMMGRTFGRSDLDMGNVYHRVESRPKNQSKMEDLLQVRGVGPAITAVN